MAIANLMPVLPANKIQRLKANSSTNAAEGGTNLSHRGEQMPQNSAKSGVPIFDKCLALQLIGASRQRKNNRASQLSWMHTRLPIKDETSQMKKLSTSALAKHLGLTRKDLFSNLAETGYIQRQNDAWQLTEDGLRQGGAYVESSMYGQYITWL